MTDTDKNQPPIWQERIVTDPLILAGKPTVKRHPHLGRADNGAAGRGPE